MKTIPGVATRCLAAVLVFTVMAGVAESRAQLARPEVTFKEPVPFRVYQRGRDNTAEIPVSIEKAPEGAKIVGVTINGPGETRFEDGKIRGVPPGQYSLNVNVELDKRPFRFDIPSVSVGDLWVLAGQSNMEGVGDLLDVTPANEMVMALGMDGKWAKAREPLHWLVDSPDPVHSGDPATRVSRSDEQHKKRAKGAGLGLPFAVALTQATRVPIGLVPCAHGGTSMAQWDPAKKDEGGKSLYGSMLRQISLAGGNIKGVLWYQGESDANPKASEVYVKVFADFITTLRSDLSQPELPFYYVQIGRFVRGGDPKPWNLVQDAERRLVEQVPNTAVVASVDLELDDGIHVGTQGLKRIGQRLARVAQHELFGLAGATTPTLDRISKGAGNNLVVKLKGVNPGAENMFMMSGGGTIGLKPTRHICGFSIRTEDGSDIPLIFDAAVGTARDTVILKLNGKIPEKASLWYGYGFDPVCNLTDGLDMALPVFGPIPLDDFK